VLTGSTLPGRAAVRKNRSTLDEMRCALLVLATALVAAAATPAGGAAQRRCPPGGTDVVKRAGKAVVFTNDTGTYYGCLRPHGRRRELDTPDDVYSSISLLRIAGPRVAYAFEAVPECKADCPPDVHATGYVEVLDLRTGRRAVASGIGVSALVLTSSGTAVYLRGDGLHTLSRAKGDRVIDTGDIGTLRSAGNHVTWTNGGEPRSLDT
jgi:hypothetical protein